MQQISNQAVREVSTTKRGMIGTLAETPDGRKFRYAKIGASPTVIANLLVNADQVSEHANKLVDAAVAIGEREVVIASIGAVAITADQYLDGWLAVRDNTGEGRQYRISGHQTADASAENVRVYLTESIEVALDTTTEVTLQYTNWHKVVISATDQADCPAGIAQAVVAAAGFGWLQTGGECLVWGDEAFSRGSALTIGTGTAGQVEMLDAAGEPQIGIAMETGVDGEHTAAYLTMD